MRPNRAFAGMTGLAALVLAFAAASAQAEPYSNRYNDGDRRYDRYNNYDSGRYGHGSYGHGAYGHSRPYGAYDRHHHHRGHWDYHPGYYQRHCDHYDYVPGHYDYHRGGHQHYGYYR